MHLYAAGFNAWGQLQFPPLENPVEKPDIASFQKVLSDKLIEVRYASLAYTVLNTSAGLRYAGYIDECMKLGPTQQFLSSTAAVAGNGIVAIYNGYDAITQYGSLLWAAEGKTDETFSDMHGITQLVAFETGFVALSRDGKVWTWGDERYDSTLGREITNSRPAERPGLVEDLEGLPSGKIKKVAAGGYTILALTEGHDLYGWGGHPARQTAFDTPSSTPSPVVVEENDILDCSVGEAHMIVLTTGGDVYVVGDNTNGQLGVASGKTVKWKQVPFSSQGEVIVGVKAGQRSSFIVTNNAHLA
ncbi:hypothetical protein NUW58_g1716 [Xylaria curta]|uniref:Uncharacterized protein n=1 Tax=Xylaria curta TaxID=42375 RepID=A0ACC1PJ21_9PEZI|nr:hypothetical protein NUW58_g1716 [Xylaria curta]